VLPLVDDQGRDWWRCTDPYGGLPTRSRQPEVSLSLPVGGDVLVTASYVRDDARRLVQLVVCLRDTRARSASSAAAPTSCRRWRTSCARP
jgi:hypothetical protein